MWEDGSVFGADLARQPSESRTQALRTGGTLRGPSGVRWRAPRAHAPAPVVTAGQGTRHAHGGGFRGAGAGAGRGGARTSGIRTDARGERSCGGGEGAALCHVRGAGGSTMSGERGAQPLPTPPARAAWPFSGAAGNSWDRSPFLRGPRAFWLGGVCKGGQLSEGRRA